MDTTKENSVIICLIHGGWHQPLHLRHLVDALKAQGHIVVTPQLATSGNDNASQSKTYLDDVLRVHNSLLPFFEEGRKAVLVGHSFGGITATAAAWGQTVEERAARGLQGGIAALVYLAAYTDHTKPLPMNGAKYDIEEPWIDPETQLWRPDAARGFFYHDSDPEKIQPALELLTRLSEKSLACEPVCTATQVVTEKFFFVCENDRMIAAEYQRDLAEEVGATIIELECGHSPYLRIKDIQVIVEVLGKYRL